MRALLSWTFLGTLALIPGLATGCGDDDGGDTGGQCAADVPPACETCLCTNCETELAECQATENCTAESACASEKISDGTCSQDPTTETLALLTCLSDACGAGGASAGLEPEATAFLLCSKQCVDECTAPPDAGL